MVCLVTGSHNRARAEPTSRAPAALTWSDEARRAMEHDLESPQLRQLRLLEEEWFGRGSAPLPDDFDPDCEYGTPDALSSEPPPRRVERQGESVDLRWLSALKLPNIPVRWDDRVIDYLLFFKNDVSGHALMASWLRRVEIYGPMIRRRLAEAALPSDLQYVAMVESGYDPRARSHAAAQGLWQFMKRAGRHYELRIDRWVDERLDPERATRAAVEFLGELYRRFGAWELAFAAYNMGYGGLLRAVRKYNTNDYWLLSHLEAGLPHETTLYVAKITAVAIIGNNPERFGFQGLKRLPRSDLRTVEVASGTHLKHVARAAGVETDEILDLNPALLKRRTPPGKDAYPVHIPSPRFDRFVHRWRHRKPTVARSHTVRFGEKFADVARLYQTSSARLRRLNDMEAGESVSPGEVLLVPGNRPSKDVSEPKPAVTVPTAQVEVPGRKRLFYRVTSRDTATSIARFFHVSPTDLLDWNQLSEGALLQSDMLLQVFVDPELDVSQALVLTPDEVTVLTLGSEAFFDFHESQRGRVRVRYVCQAGDTVASVGKRFELSAGSVARINQFSTRHELSPGEQIVVYVPEDQVEALRRKGVLAEDPENAEESASATSADKGEPKSPAPPADAAPAATGRRTRFADKD